MSSSPGPTAWRNGCVEQQRRALERRGRIVDRQAERTDRRAVHDVEGMGEAFLLAC